MYRDVADSVVVLLAIDDVADSVVVLLTMYW